MDKMRFSAQNRDISEQTKIGIIWDKYGQNEVKCTEEVYNRNNLR